MKPPLLASILTLAIVGAAFGQYSDPFDPWRACTKACPDATKGNPMALHTCFLAAYVRVSDPHLGGEDLEAITHCMEQLLRTLGDGRFCESLAFERPEVSAAVRYFLPSATLADSPKTQRLLAKAPKIEFPLAQSARDEDHSPLLQRFLRYEKEHPD